MAIKNENPNHRFHKLLSSKSQSEINELLQVKISSLKLFFHSNTEALKTLISAIENQSKSNSWKFYSCPVCSQSFSKSLHISEHINNDHLNSTSFQSLNFLIPKRAESDKVESFVNDNSDLSGMSSERIDLVGRILFSVQKLVKFNILADTLMDMMIKITGVDNLGSLSASKLKVIATFLDGLVLECCQNSADLHIEGDDDAEEGLINADGSMLELNAKCLCDDNGSFSDSGKIAAWFYDSNLLGENVILSNWENLKRGKELKGKEIYEHLQEEYKELQAICVDKHNCMKYRSAIVTLEKVFMELVEKTNQSQEAVMRKLRGDLSDREGADNDLLRYAAANVSKEAVRLREMKMRNLVKLVKQNDSSTADAFRKQLIDADFEGAKCDTKILKKTIYTAQLQDKLIHSSALNNLEIVVPLIKIYLQKRLEDDPGSATNASLVE